MLWSENAMAWRRALYSLEVKEESIEGRFRIDDESSVLKNFSSYLLQNSATVKLVDDCFVWFNLDTSIESCFVVVDEK